MMNLVSRKFLSRLKRAFISSSGNSKSNTWNQNKTFMGKSVQ